MKATHKKVLLAAAFLLAIVTWRAASYRKSPRFVLNNSDAFILYSLKPTPALDGPTLTDFHGAGILGKVQITNSKQKAHLVNSLYDALAQGGQPGDCMAPQHGIRATKAGRTVDLLICFHCSTVDIYENGKQLSHHLPMMRDSETKRVYEQAVKEARLPVSW